MRVSRYTAIVFVLAAAAATCASAAGGGPSPGVSFGSAGVVARGAGLRFQALPAGQMTLVQAVRMRGGRVARFNAIRGSYGIPLVAFDGYTDGLSRDGSTLVLASAQASPGRSQFAVLDARTLQVRQTVTLSGTFSFDALSPNGETLYLIQHVSTPNSSSSRYYVRAYDLVHERLQKKVIFDRREHWGLMSGSPVTRTTSAAGRWVYTLYARPGGHPFVHALDATHLRAVCIDLPWRGSQAPIWRMKLHLGAGQRSLVLRQRTSGRQVAVIDTRTFRVTAT